uniref:Chitin-binding type-2 domain-containing protein n=1 Tax=Anopheles dirus TaxID=7168 RepID=A0A182NQ05_9DIPT
MMTTAVWILGLLFTVAVVQATATDLPIVIPAKRTVGTGTADEATNQGCKGNRIDCGGCNSVIMCNYQNQTVGSYDCSSLDPQRPYCTGKGICTSSLDPKCEVQSDLCPKGNKYFPVPSNCSESVYCTDKLQAIKVGGPSLSFVFNYTGQSWTARKTTADCFQINCLTTTMQNKFHVYKPYPQLYVYCGTTGPMTFLCEGENETFNEAKRTCEFSCLTSGNFAIPNDENKYYSCLPTSTGSEQFALRRVVSKRVASIQRRDLSECQTGRIECDDCNTVKICSYDKSVLAHYRCKDVDPNAPYCVGEGVCSNIPNPVGDCNKANDLCPTVGDSGYYPDPTNCSQYLYCDENSVGYEQSCVATNNVYNQTTSSCFLKRKSADCFQVDCNNSKNKDKWFVYTPSPQLYFLCSASGPVMFMCPRENHIFDLNLKRCEFHCSSAGRFAHESGDTMYYECAYTSTSKLEKFEQTCPPLLVFDRLVQKCVDSNTDPQQ